MKKAIFEQDTLDQISLEELENSVLPKRSFNVLILSNSSAGVKGLP
jgi:hypothetical protein